MSIQGFFLPPLLDKKDSQALSNKRLILIYKHITDNFNFALHFRNLVIPLLLHKFPNPYHPPAHFTTKQTTNLLKTLTFNTANNKGQTLNFKLSYLKKNQTYLSFVKLTLSHIHNCPRSTCINSGIKCITKTFQKIL